MNITCSFNSEKTLILWVWGGYVIWIHKLGVGGGVVLFESADFFMDQTYFSVCWYVIIKDI